jgi:hypothetical protein
VVKGVEELRVVSSMKDGNSGVPAALLSVTAIQDVVGLTRMGDRRCTTPAWVCACRHWRVDRTGDVMGAKP